MQSLFLKILKCGLFFGCFFTFTVHAEQHQTFSIQLKQAPLVPTLQQLALAQNVNLLIDDELQGTLTLKLDNVNLDQIFRSIAKIKQLDLWHTAAKFAGCSRSRILGNVTAKSGNSEKSIISHFKRILTANFEKNKMPFKLTLKGI